MLLLKFFVPIFLRGGVFSGLCIKSQPFAKFCWAFSYVFFEFLMEIIYVLVSDLICNLIYLQPILLQKEFGEFNTLMVDVGIKIFAYCFIKNSAKICAAVSEEWRYGFQLDIVLEPKIPVRLYTGLNY